MTVEKEAEIIKESMRRIGTKRVSAVDGMTICIDDTFYNIYVNDSEVTIEEI